MKYVYMLLLVLCTSFAISYYLGYAWFEEEYGGKERFHEASQLPFFK